jgi:transcriptional regulator with XRE-family HTH domain
MLFYFLDMKKRRGPKLGSKYTGTNVYHFGKILSEARRRKGLTQDELAGLLGTSRRVVSYYEREVGNPNIETLTKIANILKVPIERFFEHEQTERIETPVDRSLSKRMEEAQKLPPSARNEVKKLIAALLKANRIKPNKTASNKN